jgi:hypothetical protein
VRASVPVEELESRSVNAGRRKEGQEVDGSHVDAIQSSRVDSLKVYHEIPAQLYMLPSAHPFRYMLNYVSVLLIVSL